MQSADRKDSRQIRLSGGLLESATRRVETPRTPTFRGAAEVFLVRREWDDTDPSGWRGFWNIESLTMGVSGFYTFRVENQTGDYFVYTDYLESTSHMELPVIVSPANWDVVTVGEVILDWGPVDQADDYRVDMRYSDDGGTTCDRGLSRRISG